MTAIDIDTRTDDDPAMQTAHPVWCRFPHRVDEPHESTAYTVKAVEQTHIVVIEQQPAEQPRIVLETFTGIGKTCANGFTPAEAVELRDALMELVCLIGACDCGHGPLCGRPGCPGGAECEYQGDPPTTDQTTH